MKQAKRTISLRRWMGLAALAGLIVTVAAGPLQAFFPGSVGNSGSGTTGENNNNNNTGGNTGSKPPPPGGSVVPQGPGTPGQPPGTSGTPPIGVPEIDPGAAASALGLLLSGALVLTDRFRRKQAP